MKSLCSLNRVSLEFPDGSRRKVLNEITLTIKRGETILLLGPSGSGKSSLAYVLAGLIPQSIEGTVSGEINFINEDSPSVGIVFQDPEAQFCMITAEDEIAFGLENRKVPSSSMDSIIDAVLERYGLRNWKTKETISLSGGMKQKLAMACIMAMEPDLYVFDEPTANLDPSATRQVLSEIRRLTEEKEKTVLIIEHKVDGVMEWVDRVILLGNDGSVLADGTPQEVYVRFHKEMEQYGIWQPQLWEWSTANGLNTLPATIDDWMNCLSDDQIAGVKQRLWDEYRLDLNVETDQPVKKMDDGGSRNDAEPLWVIDRAVFQYAKMSPPVWGPISCIIPQGCWTAIIGPNGAGKSTLLSALMDFRMLTSGEIRLQNRPVHSYSVKAMAQLAGFVFQNPEHQFVTDSVWAEMMWGLPNDPEWEHHAVGLLEELGLSRVRDENPFSISQGEKRRLSVATALLTSQQALLLDEPTFGQDAETAKQLELRLATLRNEGRTIVTVTHDMDMVARWADHVIVLAGGDVVYEGMPQGLFDNVELLAGTGLEQPFAYQVLKAWHARKRGGHIVHA